MIYYRFPKCNQVDELYITQHHDFFRLGTAALANWAI